MNVLVIGGNGFIGSHLVDGLLRKNYNVRVFDIAHEKYRKPLQQVDYRISDLQHIPRLNDAMLDIDLVFHLASTTVPSTSGIDIISDIRNNIFPSIQLLDLCVRHKIEKFVFFSSGGAVYGNPEINPIPEDHKLSPVSSYGIIKATLENYIKLYKAQNDLDYLIIRPSNPYGPRQGHFNVQGVISTFLRKVYNEETLTIYGDGKAKKDYIYIEDFVEMALNLITKNVSGTFNVGSGIGTSINKIIDTIAIVTQKKTEVIFTESRSYDVQYFILDIQNLNHFIPQNFQLTTLEDGIKKYWVWLSNQIT